MAEQNPIPSATVAAHSTRDKKQILSPAEVFEAHRRLAAEFGNQANHVVAEARAREFQHQPVQRPNSPETSGRKL